MNKKRYLSAAVIFVTTFLLFSCKKSEAIKDESSTKPVGGFTIKLCYEDGEDETTYYNGTTVTIGNNNTLSASNGRVQVNGTWSLNGNKLQLTFGSGNYFSKLNKEWNIIEQSPNLIKLSGGSASSACALVLEK